MNMLHRDKDWLEKKYITEDLSLRAIADLAGVSYETVRAWLLRFGISVRKKNEHRKRKITVEEALEILAEDALDGREDLFPDPESAAYKDEVRQAKARADDEYRRRTRAELREKIKREREEREAEIIGNWSTGSAEEQMQDIQEQHDSVERGKRLEKATEKEKAHIKSRGS